MAFYSLLVWAGSREHNVVVGKQQNSREYRTAVSTEQP